MKHAPLYVIIALSSALSAGAQDADLQTLPAVPPGFEVSVFAREPLVRNPCAMAFDARGRLCVGMGPQYRNPKPDTPPDSVIILEDTDGDGVADTSKVFATGLNCIQGLAWHGRDLWIANSPDLTIARDLDGDDVADQYVRVFTDLGNIEHALHGLNWAPDGRLYMSKGNSKGRNLPERYAPKAFRELLDLPAPTGALDAPPPLTFQKGGYRAAYHDPADDWGRSGGVLRCDDLGANLELVARGLRKTTFVYRPQWDGALLKQDGEWEKFADGAQALYRPVYIETGPDGTLWVLGWGREYGVEWAKDGTQANGGRVFRIAWKGAPLRKWQDAKRARPLAQWTFDELAADLGSPLPVWRVNAQTEMVQRGASVKGELFALLLRTDLSEAAQTWALWTLGCLDATDADIGRFFEEIAAKKSSLNARLQALRILAHRAKRSAHPLPPIVASSLRDAEPRIRFEAVQAIWQARQTQSVDALQALAATETDRVTFYSAWSALRDLAGEKRLRQMLNDERAGVRRSGILSEDTDRHLTLAQPGGEPVRFVKEEIKKEEFKNRTSSPISAMPPFGPALTPANVADLVTFLISQKPTAANSSSSGFAFTTKDYGLVITHDGQPVANYVFRDATIPRPYFANLHAPDGTQVTRNFPPVKGVDATDHDTMHPGLWLAFGSLNGVDFWRNKGCIEHARFTAEPRVEGGRLSFVVEEKYLAPDGAEICRGVNAFCFVAGETLVPAQPGTLLLWRTTLRRAEGPLTFGPQHEMGLGFRVATPLVVKGGTGCIHSSHGGLNEPGNWGRIGTWWDYSGTMNGRHAGILALAATDNMRPVWSHARDYGFLALNPTGPPPDGKDVPSLPFTVPTGEELHLKFGVLLHASTDEKPLNSAKAASAVSAALDAWK